MSSAPVEAPLIRLVDDAGRAFRDHMVRAGAAAGFPELRATHDAVFAHLPAEGGRISVLAARAGMTKQSMAEIVRDLERLGLVRVDQDPSDARAKLVRYTRRGWRVVRGGQRHIDEVEDRLAGALGEERLADLREMLGVVAEVLDGGDG